MKAEKEDVQIDCGAYLQTVIDKATKSGLFDTATDAMIAQQSLAALTTRIEDLTNQVAELNKKNETAN